MPIIDLDTGAIVTTPAVTLPTDQAEWSSELQEASTLAVHFEDFADGRGYSLARQLRRGGYTGRLRATGDSGLDQLFYLRRCGFDEADLTEAEHALLKPIHLRPIPVVLQPAHRAQS